MHSTSLLSILWPFWTGILSQVSKNDDEKTLLLRVIWLDLKIMFLQEGETLLSVECYLNSDIFKKDPFYSMNTNLLNLSFSGVMKWHPMTS